MALILVVEDNEMNLDMLSRRLERRGHDVIIATDGLTGVNLAQSNMPNLILMDMSLPVMDGWEATRRIKESPDTNHIPIIALTAHALAEDRQRCFDAGCDDYESKPIKFPELLAKINGILGVQDEA
jgi:two-component system cell cycle response regulator DivK